LTTSYSNPGTLDQFPGGIGFFDNQKRSDGLGTFCSKACYSIGMQDAFTGYKAAFAWKLPLTSV